MKIVRMGKVLTSLCLVVGSALWALPGCGSSPNVEDPTAQSSDAVSVDVTPIVFGPADLGAHYQGSLDPTCRVWPGTTTTVDQYVTEIRVVSAGAVWAPLVVAAEGSFPECTVNTVMSENLFSQRGASDYVLRGLEGGTYRWDTSDYGCEFPYELFKDFQYCILTHYATRADLSNPVLTDEQMLQLLDLKRVNGRLQTGLANYTPPPIPSPLDTNPLDGTESLNKRHAYKPLTANQCQLLEAAENAHMVHDQAVVDGDYASATTLEPAVGQTNLAFEASCRDPWECTIFAMRFQSYLNPHYTQPQIAALTQAIMTAHANWTEAFGCGTGAAPDVLKLEFNRQLHQLLHTCRAINLPTAQFHTVCPQAMTEPDACPNLTCLQMVGM